MPHCAPRALSRGQPLLLPFVFPLPGRCCLCCEPASPHPQEPSLPLTRGCWPGHSSFSWKVKTDPKETEKTEGEGQSPADRGLETLRRRGRGEKAEVWAQLGLDLRQGEGVRCRQGWGERVRQAWSRLRAGGASGCPLRWGPGSALCPAGPCPPQRPPATLLRWAEAQQLQAEGVAAPRGSPGREKPSPLTSRGRGGKSAWAVGAWACVCLRRALRSVHTTSSRDSRKSLPFLGLGFSVLCGSWTRRSNVLEP